MLLCQPAQSFRANKSASIWHIRWCHHSAKRVELSFFADVWLSLILGSCGVLVYFEAELSHNQKKNMDRTNSTFATIPGTVSMPMMMAMVPPPFAFAPKQKPKKKRAPKRPKCKEVWEQGLVDGFRWKHNGEAGISKNREMTRPITPLLKEAICSIRTSSASDETQPITKFHPVTNTERKRRRTFEVIEREQDTQEEHQSLQTDEYQRFCQQHQQQANFQQVYTATMHETDTQNVLLYAERQSPPVSAPRTTLPSFGDFFESLNAAYLLYHGYELNDLFEEWYVDPSKTLNH